MSKVDDLEHRISELETLFLPNEKSSTGEYTQAQYDYASAFCLFVHAEIESCIESLLKDIVLEKYKKFESGDLSDLAFIWNLIKWYLFNCKTGEIVTRQQKLSEKFKKDNFVKIVNESNQHFFDSIKKNHGIKIENLTSLLSPLGIDPLEVNNSWCANMDSFGTLRGDRAHNCVGAYKPLDPFDAKNLVEGLVQGIKDLESVLRT